MRASLSAVVAFLLVASAVTPGLAAAATEPRFETYVAEPTLTPGATTALSVQVINDATGPNESARTAASANATLLGNGTPVSVRSGTRFVGDLLDGAPREVPFTLSVPADVASGEYDLTLRLEYEDQGESHTDRVPVTVEVSDRPRFEVVAATTDAPVGGDGDVQVTLRNAGSEAARNATVTLQSGGGLAFDGSPTAGAYAGTVGVGETTTVTVGGSVAPGADARSYPLTATVEYEDDGDAGRSRALSAGVTPAPEQTFAVSGVESSLQVGAEGTVTATVRNEGPGAAEDAVVRLVADGPTTVPQDATVAVDDLGAGESATVEYPVAITAEASDAARQLSFVVEYDRDGTPQQSDALRARVPVAAEQAFSTADVASSLRVGAEGNLTATVTNDGPKPVRDAVVTLDAAGVTVNPLEVEYAVGDLGAGESTTVRFPIEMSESAAETPRQFGLSVAYDTTAGDRRESDRLAVTAPVAPAGDRFGFEPVAASVQAGSSGPVEVEITNTGDDRLRDLNLKAFADDPLSLSDSEAYVESLPAGETATVTLGVEAGGSALTKAYPLSVDVQYELPGGDRQISDTYRVPVTVAEPEDGGGLSPALVVAGLLVVAAAGYAVYRYR
jgi:hypothetical protein